MIPAEAVLIVVRYIIAAIFGDLAAHGVVGATFTDQTFTTSVAQILVGAFGFLAPLAWGLWRSRRRALIRQLRAKPDVTVIDHTEPKA